MADSTAYEPDSDSQLPDPESTPIRDRRVVTQPYDLAIDAIVGQVDDRILYLRPLSDRPRFQRQYVWTDKLASKLVESVLLSVPIPPCYLSENDDFELDVIDGQQRIFSLYRFVDNQFKLSGLEALPELNGLRFHEIPSRERRRIQTYTLRCVVVKNESHPEVKFEIFERLNTNTVPLNAQELRNCIYRGPLNQLLEDISYSEDWLKIRKRKSPDKRLSDEELILRFFSYFILGLNSYKTPQKIWLNETAKLGRKFSEQRVEELRTVWDEAISFVLSIFKHEEAFRRPGSTAINRALFDLLMFSGVKHGSKVPDKQFVLNVTDRFFDVLEDEEFQDLISRAVDHKSRTLRRFEIWDKEVLGIL